MNKPHVRRIRVLEQKTGESHGIKRFLESVCNLHCGLPPNPTPSIPPEKEKEIDDAMSNLTEEERQVIVDIVRNCEKESYEQRQRRVIS